MLISQAAYLPGRPLDFRRKPEVSLRAKAFLMRFASVALGLAAFALLPGASAVAQTKRTLNVYNWSDYIEPTVIGAFTRETGISVRYDTFDSNDTLETKLLTGRSGYDVVVPTAYFLERQIKAGVFQKLDKSKLPNVVHVWPEIAQRLAKYDPGNIYAVNYM
jgi:putrescine transport system substrate-binding protein